MPPRKGTGALRWSPTIYSITNIIICIQAITWMGTPARERKMRGIQPNFYI